MRVLAILTVRNEGAFLLEWLAHHRTVGFTDFLVFSNNCQDGTDALLDRLQELGQITHVPNPGPHKKGPQWDALKAANDHPLQAQCDWAMVLDVDEFVNIHVGDRKLGALFAALPDATAITLTWRVFGNAGVVNYADKPITETFTRAAPRRIEYPWRAIMFKTLFKLDGTYAKLGVHRPRAPDDSHLAQARWYDCTGRELDDAFRRQRLFSHPGQDNYQIAQLNHYPLGAMESYLVKTDRGRANREDGPMGMDYWVERNWSTDLDETILPYSAQRDPLWARLAADEVLSDLHAAAVRWRRQKFEDLMLDDGFRALFGRLVMTPPARTVPPQLTRYIFQFANRSRQSEE